VGGFGVQGGGGLKDTVVLKPSQHEDPQERIEDEPGGEARPAFFEKVHKESGS